MLSLWSVMIGRVGAPSVNSGQWLAHHVWEPERSTVHRLYAPKGWSGKKSIVRSADVHTYRPKGQHVMMDVYNGDPELLNDGESLLMKSLQFIQENGVHVLSSTAHVLEPQGISVVVVLMESHLTIHTWPEHGAALVDLFTCGDTQLLPIVHKLAKLFGSTLNDTKWSIHYRGYDRADDVQELVLKHRWSEKEQLLGGHPDGGLDRRPLEVWSSKMRHSAKSDKVAPRTLFVDGALRVSQAGADVYYRALVRPAMVTQTNGAGRVAVVSMGGIGSVRELVQYENVHKITMLELNAGPQAAVRTYMPDLNDCSGAAHRGLSKVECTSLPNVQTVLLNTTPALFEASAAHWFDAQRGGAEGSSCASDHTGVFDVILVDVMPASSRISTTLQSAILCVLSPNGTVVMTGDAARSRPIPDSVTLATYKVAIPGRVDSATYSLLCKSRQCKTRLSESIGKIGLTFADAMD